MATPLREYGLENVRALPSLPQQPPVASAPSARLFVSWWDKTIMIWRLNPPSETAMPQDTQVSRKLVAKINLDDKTAIRSVSIDTQGKLLAVSTGSGVKLFQLIHLKHAEKQRMRIRKLPVPNTLATSGAHVVRFSPNSKWLACVTLDSEIYIARLAQDTKDRMRVLSKVVELDRRHHNYSSTAYKAHDQTITRIAFASDSSVFVAADYAGYLDSWVLEGHEDLTAPAVDVAKKASDAGSSVSVSDSDSSSDSSDDEDTTVIFHGQHWTDNPAGHLLPKLDSTPLVLTFRPHREQGDTHALTNGNPGIHSTRNNPHAHSHELPPGKHNLFVMTARHQMYEFDVLAGHLSDWSRRNPTAVLPGDFTKIRDRVLDAVWDVSGNRERIWLYGNSFVCMLNVGEDLNSDLKTKALKRRNDDQGVDAQKRRKLESGAGGVVSNVKAKPATRYEDGVGVEIDLKRKSRREEDEEEDDEADDDIDLQLTRVTSADDGGKLEMTNGDNHEHQTQRKWWCTFKFRPILGIVPLEGDSEDALEVVIVECPTTRSKSG
jgi:U3 small nucleolar RNA-associated protein 4